MIAPFLKSQLEPVAQRQRRWRLQSQLAICWGAAALLGFLLVLVQRAAGASVPGLILLLGVATTIASAVIWKRTQKWEPDYRQIARRIEHEHPELHALLLTAVEQTPDLATGEFNYLQQRVIDEAVSQNKQHQWIETVSRRRLLAMEWVQLFALIALVFALYGLRSPGRRGAAGGAAALAEKDQKITVTPGDTSVERGSALVVLARFTGPLPSSAELIIESGPGNSRRIPLVKNLDDPVFGGSLAEVTNHLSYHIEYAGKQTRDFKVTVFEHPRLERADAKIHFPEYTGIAEKEIKDTHRVSAVEGSKLDLALQLNKPVATAKLIAKDQSVIPLDVETNQPAASLKGFALDASQTYVLQLVDAEGRTNKVPAQFVFEAMKNRAPELKLSAPRGDQRVSPIEEVSFQGEAWDDFGLRSYGLAYTMSGQEPKFIELGQTTTANEKRSFTYLLKLEDLSLQADQLLSYFLWADDVGPDGKLRRTASDMYFCEIRPFEEIFREGQSQDGHDQEKQQGGGAGKGNEALKLAELQKQITIATWNLQRHLAPAARPPTLTAKPAPKPPSTPRVLPSPKRSSAND